MRTLVSALGIAAVLTLPARSSSQEGGVPGSQGVPLHAGELSEATPARGDTLGGPRAAEEAKFFNRAWPADDIPADAHDRARATFSLVQAARNARAWELVGPSVTRVSDLLTYTGARATVSGRVTALAIAPSCDRNRCRLWLAAAGGGVWRTDDALDEQPRWRVVSGAFDTNAIGCLVVDTHDATGNTVYAGTGEPNASADSAAGVGIYKTTDGGNTWTLLPGSRAATNGRAVASIVIDPTNANVLWVGTTRAVRGVGAVTGGGVTLNPAYPGWGLWRSADGGNTFQPVAVNSSTAVNHPDVGIRGVTQVALAPNDPSTVYFSAFGKGVRRISARFDPPIAPVPSPGITPVSYGVFAPQTTRSDDRTSFALTVKGGKTRLYAGNGTVGAPLPASAVFRQDDADRSAPAVVASWVRLTSTADDPADPAWATYDFCTGQCWYDILVYSPPGRPDTVFVLGSYQYGEYWRVSNSRGLLVSTTAGEPDPRNGFRTFTDVSWDATPPGAPDGLHPDHHAIVVSPSNPNVFFSGTDGGIVRSNGRWADASAQCDARGLPAAELVGCRRLLSRVPEKLVDMNPGLSTLQFQSLSVSPRRPDESVLGGTQDNGTLLFTGDTTAWSTTINGDGGLSGFDAWDDRTRFHTYYGPYVDVNFRGNMTTGWSWVSDPFVVYPENWNFYVPIIADPAVGGTIFLGQQHVWRTKDSGGSRTFLETYCSEFVAAPGPAPDLCGDWVPMGGLYGEAAGDLTGPFYGPDRISGFDFVAAVTRSSGDSSTMWVGTNTGRLFLTHNADAEPASAVSYVRVDAAGSPGRFVSGIAADPANPNRAFVSYSGYSAITPATPGHVFQVVYDPASGTATFTDLNSDGTSACPAGAPGPLCDLPINGLARDDLTGDLYAASDFGVLKRSARSGSWTVAGAGLPRVEVSALALHSGARLLYAATHGRSAWRLELGDR